MTAPRSLALLALIGAGGCDPTPDELCQGGECFSLDDFGDELRQRLDGNAVGWAYSVYYDGRAVEFDSGGMRRTAADPPAQAMSIFDRVNVASVTKTLLTFATLNVLDDHGIGLDDPVAPHLPTNWSPGPGVDQITFRQLLSQTSGLIGTGSIGDCTYSGMKTRIATGIDPNAIGDYSYQNFNFCLLRVVLPTIDGVPHFGLDVFDALFTTDGFFDIMQAQVFDPAAVYDVRGQSESPDPTLYYGFPDPGWNGVDTGYEEHIAGGGTLHLSMLELSKVIWMADQTNEIIDATQRTEMRTLVVNDPANNRFGALGIYEQQVSGGAAYHHNGGLNLEVSPWSSSQQAGTRSVHYTFPNGVAAALTFNSIGTLNNPNSVMVSAYEAAWTPEVP